MQLNGTYYVGSFNGDPTPSSSGEWDMADIASAVVLFASWVGVFMRYGLGVEAFVFAALLALLVISGILDRKGRAPGILSIAMAVLWIATLWFMPYGLGPSASALGAGGLVPFFASIFGVGPLPVLLDGVLGAGLMFVLCVLAVIVIGIMTGSELLKPANFLTGMALGCFFGTTGSLLLVLLTLAFLAVFYLIGRIASSRSSDGMLAPQLYTSGFGSGRKQKIPPVGLALAAAVMVMLIFL